MNWEIFGKGLSKAVKEFGDIQAQQTKLKTGLLANQIQAEQNLIYKLQEAKEDRKQKMDFIKELQSKFNQRTGIEDNLGIEAPQVRVGAGGEPTLEYPKAKDKEFNIKIGLNRINKKEQLYEQTQDEKYKLTPQEQRFKDTYGDMEQGDYKKTIEAKILKGTATQDEINRYNLLRIKPEDNLKKEIETKILSGTATKEEIDRYNQLKGKSMEEEMRNKNLSIASSLRQEFNQSNIFKNYLTVESQYKGLQAAYQLSLSPDNESRVASDQALIVTLNKMLDPTSVVRESEYARTPEGVGLMNRLQSYLPKLKRGGQNISNEDRRAVYDMARQLLNASGESLNRHIDRYVNIADMYGINPNLILGGIKKFEIGKQDNNTDTRIEQARKLGYSDEEIQNYLKSKESK